MVASASSSYDTLLLGGVALTDAGTFLAFLTLPPNFLAMPLPSLVPRAFPLKNGSGHPFFKAKALNGIITHLKRIFTLKKAT